MVVPAYTDISHFRAPFKNWPHLGVGAVTASPSDVASSPLAAIVAEEKETGVRIFQPSVAAAILEMLKGFSVIFLSNDAVKIELAVPGDVREKASAWVARKVGEGKSVIAGSPAGLTAFLSPVVVDRTLEAVTGTSGEKEKAGAGTLPLSAVLVRGTSKAGLFGPVGIAVAALAGVGLVVYLATRKKGRTQSHRAKSNRRHRRHRR